MNIHRAFHNAALRRAELRNYSSNPLDRRDAMARDLSLRAQGRELPEQGAVNVMTPRGIRKMVLQQAGRRAEVTGRFYGLGAEPDYGSMLMQPTTPGIVAPSWMENITSFAKQIAPIYSQVALLREQSKRRAAGLPPLDPSQIAPTLRVQAGVDPGVMNMGKIALYGGLGIGAALLIRSFMR